MPWVFFSWLIPRVPCFSLTRRSNAAFCEWREGKRKACSASMNLSFRRVSCEFLIRRGKNRRSAFSVGLRSYRTCLAAVIIVGAAAALHECSCATWFPCACAARQLIWPGRPPFFATKKSLLPAQTKSFVAVVVVAVVRIIRLYYFLLVVMRTTRFHYSMFLIHVLQLCMEILDLLLTCKPFHFWLKAPSTHHPVSFFFPCSVSVCEYALTEHEQEQAASERSIF